MRPISTIDRVLDALQKDGKIQDFGVHQSTEHKKKIDEQLKEYELEKKLMVARDKEELSKHMLSF